MAITTTTAAGSDRFDFSDAMTDLTAMEINLTSRTIPGLASLGDVVASFDLALAGNLIGNGQLSFPGEDHAAMVLLVQGDDGFWYDAGSLTRIGEIWRNDPLRGSLMLSGSYAVVAINVALTELEGVVRAAGVARSGVRLHLETDLVDVWTLA